jgi:hypothetical protein
MTDKVNKQDAPDLPAQMSAEQKMCVCGHTASIHEWHDESSSCCRARVHLNGSFGVHGGTPCMCSGYSPTEQSQDPLPPPLHAFELRVVIGGNTWPFVLRAIADIARRIEETGENCGIASGGGGGCFSVDLARREISPDDYDRELIAWAEARRPGKAATQV